MTESPNSKFTAQQKLFFDRYMELLGNRNAGTQAAIQAKYSAKTAAVQASRLLNSVKGIEEVNRRLEEIGMSKAEVAARISTLARADVQDFFKEETVIEYPKQLVPLAVVIQQLEEEIQFEEEVAERTGLSGMSRKGKRSEEEDAEDDPYDVFFKQQQRRKNRLIRLQIQLKRNPNAKEVVVGEPIERKIQKLDLTQAREKGVLHLLKSSKPTKYGESIELYPIDSALRDVAKWNGLFVNRLIVDDKRTAGQLSDADLEAIAAKG